MPIIFDEEQFTVLEIAKRRNITVQGVRKAIKDERLTATKVASTWFISRRELEEKGWL